MERRDADPDCGPVTGDLPDRDSVAILSVATSSGVIVDLCGQAQELLHATSAELLGADLVAALARASLVEVGVVAQALQQQRLQRWTTGEPPNERSFQAKRYSAATVDFVVVAEQTCALRERRELTWALTALEKLQALTLTAGAVGPLAHDLNNMLTAILAQAALGLELSSADPRVAQLLRCVCDAAGRASHLTRALLQLGRSDCVGVAHTELNRTVREAMGIVRMVVGEAIAVVFDLAEGSLPVALAPAVLERILLNLVANARDAIPAAGEIEISTRRVGEAALLAVKDNGQGMSTRVVARALEPAFSTKESGSGLGLALARRTVESTGGKVLLRSDVGIGTTVEVWLPLVPRRPE